MLYSIIGLICVTLVGLLAHGLGICLVTAVKKALKGQPSLLAAIMMSGLWVGAYSVLANYNDWSHPFPRFAGHVWFALGGFVFGIGASINQACSVSTLYQFARGNLSMLFTMVGWFAGWYLWDSILSSFSIPMNYQKLPLLSEQFVNIMFAFSVLFTLIIIVRFPQERGRWIGVSAIGLLVAALFFIELMWAPSRLLQDVGLTVVEDKESPSIYRISLALMMLIGMRISVMWHSAQRFRWPTLYKFMRHGLGGLMMGIGGAIALGGNDAQILMGIPSISYGAIIAIVFMLIGIAFEQYIYTYYNDFKLRIYSRRSSTSGSGESG